jgi:hypothetical protein
MPSEHDGRCKNCKWWEFGYCGRENTIGALFEIVATAADDHGLTTALKTSPDFGCVQYEAHADH